jgi:hypothetical protein
MVSDEFLIDLWGSPEPEVPIKSSVFNSITLTKYFQDRLLSSSWYKGFGIVNQRAMAGQLSQWKRLGVPADTVYAMIDLYMEDYTMRGKSPSWQDFIYQRDKLASSLPNTGDKSQLDTDPLLEADYNPEEAMRQYLAERNN